MKPILPGINGPADIRNLSVDELNRLADEIREFLVTSVSRTGGHLAANLGVVELTLALHFVFDSPVDQIVWDVGHQAYVHKILTGRRDDFATLRQYGGLSGFPKHAESPHDIMDTGHSSTSISAALGLAVARDLSGAKNRVVAVIGDGALTGGVALEALNHAGHYGTDLIVVLNDNEMSIAPNVGAMAGYLARLRSNPALYRFKESIEQLVRRLPKVGNPLANWIGRLKDSLKYLVVPGMLFEELGFAYFGPVDGHNIPGLTKAFQDAIERGGPVLIHVRTVKGKGYAPAQTNPQKFHGTNPFDVETGKVMPENGPPSYTRIFGQTLVELAAHDPRLVAITAAMPEGTGLDRFARRYAGRFFDVGIAEQHALSLAAGLARGGMRPVVAVYSSFMQRGYDQIIQDICLQKLPVILALDRAGLVGEDGPTHHGVFDLSFLRTAPGLIIMAPRDENELRHMLNSALHYNGPVAIRYPRGSGLGVELDRELQVLEPGRAELLRHGQDVALVAIGAGVTRCLEAADELAREGVSAAVLNARFAAPLDGRAIVDLATKTGNLVTVEENVLPGGFGSAVLELLAGRNVPAHVITLGLPDRFIEQGPRELLIKKYGLDAPAIAGAAREITKRPVRA